MAVPENIFIKDYTYDLPAEKIALFPAEKRDASRLLVYREGRIEDRQFTHLPEEIPAGTLMVLNNTRVIEARVLFKKATGGVIELFCLEPYEQGIEAALAATGSCRWYCLIGGASKWKPGQVLEKEVETGGPAAKLQAHYIDKSEDRFIIEFSWEPELSFAEVLHAAGAIPLPPYIKRTAENVDSERYQTIFNREQGSVAAPTAALHFTEEVMNELKSRGVETAYLTLHVGAGTFKPVKAEQISEHSMHSEPFSISIQTLRQLINAPRIIAVGTTSLRTLESLYWLGVKLVEGKMHGSEWELRQWEPYSLEPSPLSWRESLEALIKWMENNNQNELHCRTSLIIVPGYRFRSVSGLVTNFHQPQSTLLLLVAAFIGKDWRIVYDHALANDYRFLSYGDSSLLWRD